MTRAHVRLALASSWLMVSAIVGLLLTPDTAAGWLSWAVLGLGLPVGLWVVTTPAPQTMSEAIHSGRD